jgi:hypothetical protein
MCLIVELPHFWEVGGQEHADPVIISMARLSANQKASPNTSPALNQEFNNLTIQQFFYS